MEVQTPSGTAPPDVRSRGGARWVSALAVGALVLLAGASAAAHPSGLLIGFPSMEVAGLGLAAFTLVLRSGATALGLLALPALAAIAAAFVQPSFRSPWLFTGPPLFALALAGVVMAVASAPPRPPRALLLPVMFAIYAGAAYEVQSRVGPDGDEPQYLMVAESLIRDHDLALDQDFREERYRRFFDRPLRPDFRIRGPEGQIYSLHAVGLSVLILPAYFLGGYAGASFFMALLAAFLVRELRRLIVAASGQEGLAEGTAWLLGLSPPLLHYAGLIFTEIPAALLLCVGLRAAAFGRSPSARLAAAICAAALPWLNVRYSILALAVAAALAWRWREDGDGSGEGGARLRVLLTPGLVVVGSALALGLYHYELWGFFDPRRVYGRRREFSLDILPEGLPGLFLDQEFGLFAYAPLFVLCLAGILPLWRRSRALVLGGAVAALGVIATASVWPMWRGGFNPPARFLVPLVPVMGTALALYLRRGVRPAAALLAGWSLWCGLGGALQVETIHRDRDGVAPYFRTESGAREWTGALPSFVLPEDRATRALAWPWLFLLALPLIGASRRGEGASRSRPRSREVFLSVSAFMAVAMAADRVSPRPRRAERDAVRLLGSPSLLIPALQWQPSSEAAWTADLFYEPHRAPAGLVFATALRLRPGRHFLRLDTPDLPDSGAAPALLVRERRRATTVSWPMETRDGTLHSGFAIDEDADYDLLLVGGDPVWIRRIQLKLTP